MPLKASQGGCYMIEAERLTRVFGPLAAVKEVSFTVRPGEIMGLLGPNGAGKTTILRMLATQIVPTSGTARVAGADVVNQPQEVRAQLGYLPEVVPLYEDMEVGEYLAFVAEGRGLSGRDRQERLEWVAEACALALVWYQPIGQLSKGYRQRVGLAQALVHDPPCLILDEPTSGLDPLQILEIRRLIKDLAQNKAVIFSTHILPEVEALADRITIINQGEVIAQGDFSILSKAAGLEASMLLALKQDWCDWTGLTQGEIEPLGRRDGLYWYRLKGGPKLFEELHQLLCAHGLVPVVLERESEDLEHIFLKLVAKGKEDVHARA